VANPDTSQARRSDLGGGGGLAGCVDHARRSHAVGVSIRGSAFGELQSGSAQGRLTAWSVLGRGWAARPVFGWGPGNAWPAFVSSGTPTELEARGYGDSHNILMEAAVTTGIVGLAAFLVLAGVTGSHM
jgi:O-antigen ligase